MAVTWDVAEVVDFNEKFVTTNELGKEMWNTDCEAVVYGLMGIGYGEITKDNYKVIAKRLWLRERVFGSMRRVANGEPHYFTVGEVKSYIGFKTNITYKPDSKVTFYKKLEHYAGDRLGIGLDT